MLSFEFDKNAKHVNGLLGLGSRSGFFSSCSCFYFSSSSFVSSTQKHGTKLGRKKPTLYCAFDLLPELLKMMGLRNFGFLVERNFFRFG